MKKIVLLLIIVINAVTCNRQHVNDEFDKNLFHFSVPKSIEKDKMQKYYTSVFYTNVNGFELDRTGGAIGYVDKVFIFKNILFVLDMRFAKKVFAYDIENGGNFLFSVGNKGKGPGEFLFISDFSVDSSINQLIITDMHQRKICYFDLNGNFLKEIRLNFTPLKIFCYNDYLYFINNMQNENDWGVKVTDKNAKVLKEYFPFKDFPLMVINESEFFTVDNKLLLNYPYCDTIFQFKKLTKVPYLVMDTGEDSFISYAKRNGLNSKNIRPYIMPGNQERNADFKNIIVPKTYFEDHKLRIFGFLKDSKFGFILQSKLQKEIQPSLGYLSDDILYFPVNLRLYHGDYGTINVVESSQITKTDMTLVEKNQNYISKQLIEDIKNADMDCNPFIIFYK